MRPFFASRNLHSYRKLMRPNRRDGEIRPCRFIFPAPLPGVKQGGSGLLLALLAGHAADSGCPSVRGGTELVRSDRRNLLHGSRFQSQSRPLDASDLPCGSDRSGDRTRTTGRCRRKSRQGLLLHPPPPICYALAASIDLREPVRSAPPPGRVRVEPDHDRRVPRRRSSRMVSKRRAPERPIIEESARRPSRPRM